MGDQSPGQFPGFLHDLRPHLIESVLHLVPVGGFAIGPGASDGDGWDFEADGVRKLGVAAADLRVEAPHCGWAALRAVAIARSCGSHLKGMMMPSLMLQDGPAQPSISKIKALGFMSAERWSW